MAKGISKPRSAASYLAWARLWARYIDIIIYASVLSFGLAWVFPAFASLNQVVITLIILPMSLLVDALVLSAFGSSIGKAIAGVKIVDIDLHRPGFYLNMKREVRIWGALGIGIPIIALFTLMSSYNELRDDGATGWDRDTGTHAVSTGSNPTRTYLAAIIYFALLIGILAAGYWVQLLAAPSAAVPATTEAASSALTREQDLRDTATSLNVKTPMKIDKYTTLVKVESGANDLTYYYDVKTDSEHFAEMSDALRQNLLKSYCANDSIGGFGVSAIYDYSAGKEHLGSFAFLPAQCPSAPVSGQPAQ